MKRILTLILTALVFSTHSVQVEAKNNKIDEFKIKRLVSKMDKYSNDHSTKKLRTLYSPDFKSGDGFNFEEFFSLVDTTFSSYDNIKYEVKIKNIDIENDLAQVELVDRTTGILIGKNDSGLTFGDLAGDCDYIIYLKKVGGKWLISNDYIVSEKTSLKYGDARDVKMEIAAPERVDLGSEYSVLLQMERPANLLVIAALGREEIALPLNHSEEIFRKLSAEGELERIVQANTSGKNEYAVASVGFTKLKLGEDLASIKFQMSGLAFLMSRVNTKPLENIIQKTTLEIAPQNEEPPEVEAPKEEKAPEVGTVKEEPIEEPAAVE